MKTSRVVLTFCVVTLFIAGVTAYCEDKGSSSVTVFGSSEKNSSDSETSASGSDSKTSPDIEIYGSLSSSSSRVVYEITGSKIGGVRVSSPVTIPSEGAIMFVDAGITRAFTIVRVDKAGRETQVLNVSPELAIGKRLSKGTYKIYPEDLDSAFPLEKLTAKVQIGLVESEIGQAQ